MMGSPTALSVVSALLVALAGAVLTLPPRRGWHGSLGSRPQRTGSAAGGGQVPDDEAIQAPAEVDIGLLLIEVAAVLRAGATPALAWSRTLERAGVDRGQEPGEDGVPPALRTLGGPVGESWLPRWCRGRLRWRPPARGLTFFLF